MILKERGERVVSLLLYLPEFVSAHLLDELKCIVLKSRCCKERKTWDLC